jgi:hypothetical protein
VTSGFHNFFDDAKDLRDVLMIPAPQNSCLFPVENIATAIIAEPFIGAAKQGFAAVFAAGSADRLFFLYHSH